MTNSPTDTQKFSAGYYNWILWLIVMIDAVAAPLFFVGAYYPFSGEGLANPNLNIWGRLGLFMFLATFGVFAAGHLQVVWTELKRGGYAILVDQDGIHPWRTCKRTITWAEIDDITIHNLSQHSSRCLEIELKRKAGKYPSPYKAINLFRTFTLRRFSTRLSMYLDGVACSNSELQQQINHYWNTNKHEP